MYTLYFDFETYDPELIEKGSCYIWNPEFTILGMAYAIDGGPTDYTLDYNEMRELIHNATSLIAHNAVYELGCIKWLNMQARKERGELQIDFKYKAVFCTRIGSKLENNLRRSHSLEKLSSSLLGRSKDQQRFGRLVMSHTYADGSKIVDYPKKYYKTTDEEYKKDTEEKYIQKATEWAMGNMNFMAQHWPEVVEEYAKNDVDLTRELHKLWISKLELHLYHTFSDLSKVVVEMRHKGVRVDLQKAREAWNVLDDKVQELEQEAQEKGWWVNWDSPKQLGELLDHLGIDSPLNENGAKRTDKKTLEDIKHPVARLILEWRKYTKARDDFVGMILEKNINGRIHGQIHILGASATGRFSHSTPNLGQIPSRDKEIGPLLRSLFIAEDGEGWRSLDFSAQEPRLFTHWASICHKAKPLFKKQKYNNLKKKWEFESGYTKFDCPMIVSLVTEYFNNPKLDSHKFNQNLIQQATGIDIDRNTTKTFALGKAYGKGVRSTAEQLGCAYEQALEFSKAFDSAAPYISMTSDYAQYLFITRGYIKTFLGRANRFDGVGYRAYNYLIQGSAADQTAICMLHIYYKLGIIPGTVVHDEVNFSGTRKQAEKVKDIMENAIKLEIPSYTEIGEGISWAEAKGK
jgi:DNA polymerase I-like protein with 3'-5' exonuclease and polymerase domains